MKSSPVLNLKFGLILNFSSINFGIITLPISQLFLMCVQLSQIKISSLLLRFFKLFAPFIAVFKIPFFLASRIEKDVIW